MSLSKKLSQIATGQSVWPGRLSTWIRLDSVTSYSIESIDGIIEDPHHNYDIVVMYMGDGYRLVGENQKHSAYAGELNTSHKMNGVDVKNAFPVSLYEFARVIWWAYLHKISNEEVAKQFMFQEPNQNGKLWTWDGQGGLKESSVV